MRSLALAAMVAMAGSCSEPPARPGAASHAASSRPVPGQPTSVPARPTSVRAPGSLPRPPADWRDAPLTPGDWQWTMEQGKSTARFGGNLLVLQCDRAAAAVRLLRSGHMASDPVLVTITTSSGTRALNGSAVAGPPAGIMLAIAINDGLLDAMAFSRGRFVVETAGEPALHVPSWSEVSRVVEDCR